jgi:hypothetical protein
MMKIRRLRSVVALSAWILALSLAGCQTAQQQVPAEVKAADERADAQDNEARGVAEASLGKDAEVLAHGNLAQNGLEQVLAVNPFATKAAPNAGGANSSPIFVTRAAVLEKNDGKWSQVLLCDEHLKNPYGYLRGSLAARVNGWRLEYTQDAKDGLEMKFTPMERVDAVHVNADQSYEQKSPAFDVRWNPSAKRYQSFDDSHERYLSEVPTLETPQSILK